MLRRFSPLFLSIMLPTLAYAQGPRRSRFDSGMPPIQIELTKDSVRRILAALPEVTKTAAKHQSQFMAGLTGGAGAVGAARLSPEESDKLRGIISKHGFTSEEFAMQVSALVATYMVLNPEALEKQLPSEDKPEIKAILRDPTVDQAQKDALRRQIKFTRANKAKIRAQLEVFASDKNKAVVRPVMDEVRWAFEAAEAEAKRSVKTKPPWPPRSELK